MYIHINIYEIKVRISTKNISLYNMINKYYEFFLVDDLDEYDVDILLDRCGYFSKENPLCPSKKSINIGTDIKIDYEENKYFFKNQEVSAILEHEDGKYKLRGRLVPQKIRHLLHVSLQGFSRIDKYYNRFIIKTCVHDLLFILLEKKYKTCILHASVATNGKNTFVFTGLGGSGKSTMASALGYLKGYTILSDNYAFLSGKELYPFPELPRITRGTQKLLGIKLQSKADGTKNYFDNSVENIKQKYIVDKIFICSHGEDFSLQKEDDIEQLFEVLYSINNYTKEFPEYLNLSMLSLVGLFNTNKQRIGNLNKIVKENKFYYLQNNKDLKTNIKKIISV